MKKPNWYADRTESGPLPAHQFGILDGTIRHGKINTAPTLCGQECFLFSHVFLKYLTHSLASMRAVGLLESSSRLRQYKGGVVLSFTDDMLNSRSRD